MLDVYTTDWAIKWLDREIKHPESTTQKMVDFLHDFRAATLKEAADRAVAWLADSTSGIDPALAATNSGKWLVRLRARQTESLRAAIEGETK